MNNQILRVLRADAYDALELSALAHGGVGACAVGTWTDTGRIPCCIIGHATSSLGNAPECTRSAIDEVSDTEMGEALIATFGSLNEMVSLNDMNIREEDTTGRIPFATWCERLNVVRGS